MEWIGPVVVAVVGAILLVIKGLWGTDEPTRTTVEHADPDVVLDDGKTDSERLEDLGL